MVLVLCWVSFMLNVIYADCYIWALYAESRYAECRGALSSLAYIWVELSIELTLGATTLSTITLRITTFSTTALISITNKTRHSAYFMILSLMVECCYAECQLCCAMYAECQLCCAMYAKCQLCCAMYAECQLCCVINQLFMLSVVMLKVSMLSVMAPLNLLEHPPQFFNKPLLFIHCFLKASFDHFWRTFECF